VRLPVHLAAKRKSLKTEDAKSRDDDDFEEPVKATELMSQDEDAWEEEDLESGENSADPTIEVSGEPVATRRAGEDQETSDDAEPENSWDAKSDVADGDSTTFGSEGLSALSDWNRLNSDDLMREVEDLYPKDEDNSQAELLRARAEIAREELGSDEERAAFDLDAEVDKLIAFQRQASQNEAARAAAAARRKTTGIPGEVVEGPPDFPELADYEKAHLLHEQLAKRPVLDLDKLAESFPEVRSHERFKEYVSAKNVTVMVQAGRVGSEAGQVAGGLERVVLEVMGAAVKAALNNNPGLTSPGGALFRSMQHLSTSLLVYDARVRKHTHTHT
jgi:hypothetical protein